MEHFVIIVNDWKLLTIITKSSIFDVAAVLDPLCILSILHRYPLQQPESNFCGLIDFNLRSIEFFNSIYSNFQDEKELQAKLVH